MKNNFGKERKRKEKRLHEQTDFLTKEALTREKKARFFLHKKVKAAAALVVPSFFSFFKALQRHKMCSTTMLTENSQIQGSQILRNRFHDAKFCFQNFLVLKNIQRKHFQKVFFGIIRKNNSLK